MFSGAAADLRCEFSERCAEGPGENIDEIVYKNFDELQSALSEREIFHPSEEYHRQEWLNSDSKILEVINSYHGFCHVCKKHFYVRSVPTDTNSFFQLHLNTRYHREFRDSQFSRLKEMITWEEKWKTGKCNVCQISGLVAFVRDMDCSLAKLSSSHNCFCMISMQENNKEFLRKISLLRKYCRLSVFRDKFIKHLNKDSACLLCCTKIPWSGENVKIHLGSESHFENFCSLVWSRHNLTPKDLLNGFYLEMIIRWIYSCTFKSPKNLYSDYESELLECASLSSDAKALEFTYGSGNYCPLEIEKLLAYHPSDFTQKGQCLLCNQSIDADHFETKSHLSKAENLSAGSFCDFKYYEAFCTNWMDRLERHLETIQKYRQLKEGTNFLRLKIGGRKAELTVMKRLFLKKLALVKRPPPKRLNQGYECPVCDLYILASSAANHVTDYRHVYYSKKWQELEKLAEDSRFFEPFQNRQKHFICLLCGTYAKVSHFFSHLKGIPHAKRFEWYCSLKNEIPISLAIEVTSQQSVVCHLCDSLLLKSIKRNKLLVDVSVIQNHWPCPEVTKQKEETEASLKKSEDMERPCLTCQGSLRAHENGCLTNILNFESLEKSFKGIVDVYEKAMFERIMGKTKSAVRDIQDTTRKQREEATCKCGQSELQCKCGNLNDDLTKGEESKKKIRKIEANHVENKKTEEKKTKPGEIQKEEEHEILVISGLTESERKFELVKRLKKFGKILFLHSGQTSVEVRFRQRGIAHKVAASTNLFPNSKPPVTVAVVQRKFSESKFSPMNMDLLKLLEEPLDLVKFVAKLTATVTAASESTSELEREKSVCTMINRAVQCLFPQCRCYPFGSRLSGLMFNNSDLDVFLDCGGMYEGTQNQEGKLIHDVAKALRKIQEVAKLVVIDKARVPIISFFHKPTGLHCDVSFKNALSIHNTLLIKFLVSLNYEVKCVIVFLKYWVQLNGLHRPPFFSSYAITMMAIFYLQQLNPPLLPTVEELQKNFKGQRLTIGGWDCSFSENASKYSRGKDVFPLQVILGGFFSYYANFDYVKNVISPLDGKPLPRKAFCPDSQVRLPMCYKRHILNCPLPLEKLVCEKIPICVIDPIDLSHVLTKSFTPTGLEMFKYYCEVSAKALKNDNHKKLITSSSL